MTHTITNMILMILICFTLSAMPINKNLLSFDFSRFKTANSINQTTKNNGASFTYTLNKNDSIFLNPNELEFEIQVESTGNKFNWLSEPELVLEITDSSGLTNTINNSIFVRSFSGNKKNNPTSFKYLLDLSKKNLGLNNGTYKIKLYGDHESLSTSEPIELTVSYFEDVNYISGVSSSNAKNSYLILYFTDNTNKHIVPIARKTAPKNKVFRTTINGLLEAPNGSLGLSVEKIAPRVSQIRYSSGLVTCYLKSNDVIPFSESTSKAKNALESLNRTIMDIQTPYAINKIQYLVDGEPSKFFFDGTDLTELVTRNNNPSVYLGLKTSSDRVLLTPKTILSDDIETIVANFIKILKTGIVPNQDSENLLPILPEQVLLLDYKVEGVTLKLNFNTYLESVFSEKDGLIKLMLDSLSSSFSSIEGIENLEIQVEGKTINNIGNVSFKSPIEAPKFLNIE